MIGNIGKGEWIIIGVAILVIFWLGKKAPQLARTAGKSLQEFKLGMKEIPKEFNEGLKESKSEINEI